MITLRTLERATAQEVFDQVAKHLLKQGERSTGKHGFCAYRGNDGMMCAAGCLIGPKEYRKKFEGYDWTDMVRYHQVCSTHKTLILDLQYIHDNSKPARWSHSLEALAKEHDLNAEVLNKAKAKSV